MTATRIIWGDAMALTVSRGLQDVQQSFYEAAENGGWVIINGDDGKRVSINPQQVLYLEEITLPAHGRKPTKPRQAAPRRRQAAGAR